MIGTTPEFKNDKIFDNLVKDIDINKDGMIDYPEFEKMMDLCARRPDIQHSPSKE